MKKQNILLYSYWIIVGIIFIIAAISVILLANGYRLNLKNFKLEKTGTIALETVPTKVNIYLNDKLIGTKTPYSISYLLPDRYKIRVEADGRKTWEKVVSVEAEKVTYQKSIILIKNKIDIKPYSSDSSNIFEKNSVLTIQNGELWDDNQYITRLSESISAAVKIKDSYLIATSQSIAYLNSDGTGYTDIINLSSQVTKMRFLDFSHTLIWQNINGDILSAEIY